MALLHTSKPGSPATLIVLQWLCYSLWGWTLAALSWFLSATLAYFFVDATGEYEYMIYLLAALVVLTPIAFVIDKLYAKREPAQKHGFAAVVLVLNAVVVFLVALGAVITAVVSAMLLLFRPGGSTAMTIAIMSAAVIAVLAALLFIRIINHRRLAAFTKISPFVMTAIVLISIVAAIAGPVHHEFNARNDRLIETHLPSVASRIQVYNQKNGHLPDRLDQLSFDDYDQDAKVLVTQNRVDYRVVTQSQNGSGGKFELCVTYQARRGDGKLDGYTGYETSDSSYIDTYSHPTGHQCYKRTTY